MNFPYSTTTDIDASYAYQGRDLAEAYGNMQNVDSGIGQGFVVGLNNGDVVQVLGPAIDSAKFGDGTVSLEGAQRAFVPCTLQSRSGKWWIAVGELNDAPDITDGTSNTNDAEPPIDPSLGSNGQSGNMADGGTDETGQPLAGEAGQDTNGTKGQSAPTTDPAPKTSGGPASKKGVSPWLLAALGFLGWAIWKSTR